MFLFGFSKKCMSKRFETLSFNVKALLYLNFQLQDINCSNSKPQPKAAEYSMTNR